MFKNTLFALFCVLFSTPVLADEVCENLASHQVCWPSDVGVVFEGAHNAQAFFGLGDGVSVGITDVGTQYDTADAFQSDYLGRTNFYDGTFEVIEADVSYSELTFTVSLVPNNLLDEPRIPNQGIPAVVSVLRLNESYLVVETFFLNPLQLEQNATWTRENLAVHQDFATYIKPLRN